MIHFREGRVSNLLFSLNLTWTSVTFFAQPYAGLLGTWADLVGFGTVVRLDLVNGWNCFNSRDQAEPQHQIPLDQLIRIVLPFKDQRCADAVRKYLSELNKKIGSDLRPAFTSRKIIDDIKGVEAKPPLSNQHCAVYKFSVITVIQIMSDTHPDNFFNASPNINTILLVNTWKKTQAGAH